VGAALGAAVPSLFGAGGPAKAVETAPAELPVHLAPGLSAAEHAALVRSGAYRARPVRVLLVGDSIALTPGIGLSVGAQQDYGVSLSNHATLGCDLDPDLEIVTNGQPGPATPGCNLWRGLWPLLAASSHAQVVALGIGRWEVLDHLLNGQWVHVGEPVWDEHVMADLRQAIAIFHDVGARVVLFTMPYVDPADRQPDGLPWSEDLPARTRAFNALVWQVARSDPGEVSVIDLNKMLGPHGFYTASLDGVDVRWTDGIHVTEAGGELLQGQILPELGRIGLEDETAAGSRR
jgi:hypothetical protein